MLCSTFCKVFGVWSLNQVKYATGLHIFLLPLYEQAIHVNWINLCNADCSDIDAVAEQYEVNLMCIICLSLIKYVTPAKQYECFFLWPFASSIEIYRLKMLLSLWLRLSFTILKEASVLQITKPCQNAQMSMCPQKSATCFFLSTKCSDEHLSRFSPYVCLESLKGLSCSENTMQNVAFVKNT